MQHEYNVVRTDKPSHKAGMARGGRPPGVHNAGHGSEEQGREAAAGRQAAVRLTVRGRRRVRRGVYGRVYGALRLEEGREYPYMRLEGESAEEGEMVFGRPPAEKIRDEISFE